ncbi:MAG: chromosome segregation protein SMC [Clostridia bacterium]|nr:chromosome segregation protein SMC [Clostridia bacterium]
MYLKSLVLHGFKSFPNRTVLTFERGATVIVGPNGSGKSNISDAMRWVLGELSSRNIRGTKMEDVIFGGTDERRPMGFAEVSVTFDNSDPENRLDSDFDEVTVTRRYYRTGESEYLINKEPKRLRDIHMLFMNTGVGREGYSIIGQGKIAEIISKKSDERRNIFEEAAGISKFRYRKEEAERKLKSTSENLSRAKDILFELESRVGPLEREAEKARRGLAIYEEKKRADVSLWLFDTKKIRVDIEEAERTWLLSKNELEIVEQVISDLEAQNETLYNRAQANKLHSAELLEKIQATTEKLHQLDNSLRVAESDFEHSAELITACRERVAEIERSEGQLSATEAGYNARRLELDESLATLNEERLLLLNEAQSLTTEVEKIKKELDGALDELTVEENLSTDLKVRIDVLKSSCESDGDRSSDIKKEIEKYKAEGELLHAEAERCDANAAGFKEKIAVCDATIAKATEALETYGNELSALSQRENECTLKRDAALQRADLLQRMADHFEGYPESIKFVMREYNEGRLSGVGEVYGPLSSLIGVEKDYILAIETALGASLQNIVVENEATAKAAIRALKSRNAGRATFYPVSAIKAKGETDEIRTASTMQGFVGRADKLVASDARYRNIVEMLLLRTLVFDNIDNASACAKRIGYKVKLVTLDGQVINAGGAFTGGSAKKDTGLLTRTTEISACRERADAMSKELAELSKKIAELNANIGSVNDEKRTAEQDKELLLTLSRSQFAALDNANAKYEANRDMLVRLEADLDSLAGARGRAEEEIISLTADYKASLERIEALREYRVRRSQEMGELDDKSDECRERANEVFVRLTEVKKDIEALSALAESLAARKAELASEKEAQGERIALLTDKRRGIDELKSEHKAEYTALESELAELTNLRREVELGGDEFEMELTKIRAKIKEKTDSQHTMIEYVLRNESKVTSLKEKQDKLGSQLWDDYEITYEDAVALGYPPVNEENREEVAAVQSSCRSRLRSLGNYNPAAIEEYSEVKTRYDYLSGQVNDLTASQDELISIISRIEEEMRTSFVSAFEAINKNFGITFKELFGGGSAELSLTDPEDVLTSGIEIKAAPPGKIIKSMSLLSGGEQSFVAIALLFAILKVNPTPFCILDEIEAALDEVNVYRFGEYVKRFDDGTQFILITHRRGTMEIGDRLYGVTMPQRGISQAIEVNVNEIEGKQKELLDGVL